MTVVLPEKTYFKIGEAADLVGVKPYIIRYWESEFKALRPAKTKSRQRLFRHRDIYLLMVIRKLLYEQKFTIEGARRRLKELQGAGVRVEEMLDALDQPVVADPEPAPAGDSELLAEVQKLRSENERLRERLGAANDADAPEGELQALVDEAHRQVREHEAELAEARKALTAERERRRELEAEVDTLRGAVGALRDDMTRRWRTLRRAVRSAGRDHA